MIDLATKTRNHLNNSMYIEVPDFLESAREFRSLTI